MDHMCIRYVYPYLTDRSAAFECMGKERNNLQGSDILILSSRKSVRIHISHLHLFNGAPLVPVFHHGEWV